MAISSTTRSCWSRNWKSCKQEAYKKENGQNAAYQSADFPPAKEPVHGTVHRLFWVLQLRRCRPLFYNGATLQEVLYERIC